ncbi:MAG: DUF6503 family protein [Vicingaceae bacterium]
MKKAIQNISVLLSIAFAIACGSQEKKSTETTQEQEPKQEVKLTESEQLISEVESAHLTEKYSSQEVIQFDMHLIFRGKTRFKGKISMTPNGGLVRMEDSIKTMIWDGQMAYISPDTSSYAKARFDLLTWSYFFAAPYKLNDPGTQKEFLGNKNLNGEKYPAFKLSFEGGVGDSPDDWYIVYQDSKTDLLAAMAYIVTYSKSQEKAEQDPHAITYEAYTEVEGIPFATQWNFWTWNEAGELHKLLGEAQISNIQFTKKAEGLFQPPAQSRQVEKPSV